jgi:poly(3-hydroxybutyrate) depolymerase
MPSISTFEHPNNGVDSDTLSINFHGAGGDGASYMSQIEGDTSLFAGITVVCPTSPWQDKDGNSYWPINNMQGVHYAMGIIQDLVLNYGIDPNKVWIGGTSNGGILSYKAFNNFPHSFQGVAVSAAYFPDTVAAATDKPIKHAHGVLDATIPLGDDTTGVIANTFPKLVAGGAKLTKILVEGAGHSISTSIDGLPTMNSILAPDSIGQIMRRNIGA